jgi:internalin A
MTHRMSRKEQTDASVKELKQLKRLTTLDLRGTKVTNLGLQELRNALPKCNVFG